MDGMDMQTYLQTNGHDNNNQVSACGKRSR